MDTYAYQFMQIGLFCEENTLNTDGVHGYGFWKDVLVI